MVITNDLTNHIYDILKAKYYYKTILPNFSYLIDTCNLLT